MPNQPKLHYSIWVENPLSHFVHLRLKVEGLQKEVTKVTLPMWRPGRYQIQNFTQNIFLFEPKSTDSGEVLPYSKPSKDCWEIINGKSSSIEIHYTFLARQMDAGGSWADEKQLYLNFVNCAFLVEDWKEVAYQLELQVPPDFQVATSLEEKNGVLQAENFEELVDSPLIASSEMHHHSFEQEGTTFHIWINGQPAIDWNKILGDFSSFTKEQYSIFRDFPHQHYHYLFQILPYKTYHGVEHHKSTVITLGPDYQFSFRNLYRDFIGISSHELFHVWNVKAIRPAQMTPYDYQQENYFDTGWVIEGITTYYGDLMLVRAGCTTSKEYFEELSKDAQRHFDNEGRHVKSLAESSVDLWVDGYFRGFPNRSVSIYVKGSLVSLMLDFDLRLTTRHSVSLDTLMHQLWERFGKKGKGYYQEDIEVICQELTNKSYTSFFDRFVRGTDPIEDYLADYLQQFGLTLDFQEEESPLARKYGVSAIFKENIATVKRLAPGSPGESCLSLEDEIIAINGRKVTPTSSDFHSYLEKNTVELTLFRQGVLKQVKIRNTGKDTFFKKVVINEAEKLNPEQEGNQKKWLHFK